MTFPGSLNTITVTGNFGSASGSAQSGSVIFTPTATVLDAAGQLVIAAVPVPYSLSGGSFATSPMPCTDNSGLVPPDWQYSVTIAVAGAAQTFTCYLPQALGGTAATVDISALAPVPGVAAPAGIYYLPNATSAPSSGPSGGGGFLYSLNGTLYWINGDNTPVVVGPGPGSEYGGINPPAGDIGGTALDPVVMSTHLAAGLPVTQGGTGQDTQPAAITALTGTQAAGEYLRSNGTAASLSALRAADLTGTVAIANGGSGQDTQAWTPILSQASVQTSNYTASANQIVPCNISGGGFTVLAPSGATTGTVFGAAVTATAGVGTNTLTLQTQGSDVFDAAGGGTTATMTLLHQALLYEYQSGVWAKLASADPYLQVAQNRQGVWYLDQFAGTDDQKMVSALSAVFAAGGGTIILSPRSHTFANQVTTSYTNNASTTVRIIGAGASPNGTLYETPSGVTAVTCNYNGSGAGQWDFQHIGLVEIAGIYFVDTNYTVPFIFATNPTPNIHDCSFTGVGSRATCTKDAIVFGGNTTSNPGVGAGDSMKYNGYEGDVRRCYFDAIRRPITFGGGANSITFRNNTIAQTCGDSTSNWGSPVYFNGNTVHGNNGLWIYANYCEMTYYQAFFHTNGAALVQNTRIGPNTLWDATGTIYGTFDSSCIGNFVDDTIWRTANTIPAVYDQYGMSNTGRTQVQSSQTATVLTRQVNVQGADLIYRYQGTGPKSEDYQGDRVFVQATHNYSLSAPGVQFCAYNGTKITDGIVYSGSNVLASPSQATFTGTDAGCFVYAASSLNAGNISAIWYVTPSSLGFSWTASTAYAQGSVVAPANSHLYQASTGGTSSTSAPTWPTGGGTVTDGTATWTDLGTSATALILSAESTASLTGLTVLFGRTSGSVQQMTQIMNHHIIGSGGTPSYTLGSTSIVGTGGTISTTGNDLGHQVTLVTGTGISAAGQLCTGTAANSFSGSGNANVCSMTPANGSAATLISAGGGAYITMSSSQWKIYANSQLSNSTTYVFNVSTLG